MELLPLVSVNMIAYNRSDYIGQAIDSILSQDYTNLELIIIDDGSIDNTTVIVDKYNDSRIKLFKNKTNKGIAYSRNKAATLSKGKFILIMDSDDIAHKNLISKKVNFLVSNPDYLGISNFMTYVNAKGGIVSCGNGILVKDSEIPYYLFYSNCLVQSSMLIITKALQKNPYNESLKSEDYDLWIRLIKSGKFHILNEDLVEVRLHSQNATNTIKHDPKGGMLEVLNNNLLNYGINFTGEQLKVHRNFLDNTTRFTIAEFIGFIVNLNEILRKNILMNNLSSDYLVEFTLKNLKLKVKSTLKSSEICILWTKLIFINLERSFKNNCLFMLQGLVKDKVVNFKTSFLHG